MKIIKNGRQISSIDDWFKYAPPKGGPVQWQDGRSAKELAKAWLTDSSVSIPEEVANILHSHDDLKDVLIDNGEPEARISFDRRGGETRNADLALQATGSGQPLAITIEAKADEPYGPTVAQVMADSLDRLLERGRGAGIDRARDLAVALLPPCQNGTPPLRDLRYQLLTAVAGALAWAQAISAPRAIMLIHDFRTDRTSEVNLERNARDLDLFVTRLANSSSAALSVGKILGPLHVPGRPLFDRPAALYLGKIVRNMSRPRGI